MAVSRTRHTLKPHIERWLRKAGKSRQDLANHLDFTVEDLARLESAELTPDVWIGWGGQGRTRPVGWSPLILKYHAERFGAAHPERLDDVVNLRVLFEIGDRVMVTATGEAGTIYKIAGEGFGRQYWFDRGLTAQSVSPGRPIEFQRPDADGAFDPVGPCDADELEAWY